MNADKRYRVILCDPPWSYSDRAQAGRRGVEFKYDLMTDDEILALPVENIAAEDAALFLWATPPRLPFALDVMRVWGLHSTILF